MRSASRRGTRASRRGGGASYWLSFSDLMSALLLIFILIMFYIVYQYFDMYETSTAALASQQQALEAAEEELATRKADLSAAEAHLSAAENELKARQEELASAQEELASAQDELSSAQDELSSAQDELAASTAQLSAAQEELTMSQDQLTLSQSQLESLRTQLAGQQQQIAAQEAQLAEQQARIEDLIGVRAEIIRDLSGALSSANIHASVDQATGAITLEADVLYSKGNSALSPEGKAVIDQFLPVYLGVLLSDEYRDFVSEIIIEGHTDSDGGYIMNLELSQERALSVASYILADGYRGITTGQKDVLRGIMTANGRAFSSPVLDASGREDKDASRRVVFKFRLTDEQMIEQLSSMLDDPE